MSGGLAAHGTLLAIGDAATPETFTNVAEVNGIGGPGLALDPVEITHHESTGAWKEFVAGLHDGGEVTLEVNFLPTANTHTGNAAGSLLHALVRRAVRHFQLTWPDSAQITWAFSALVTACEPSAPVDGKLGASVTLKLTGTVRTGAWYLFAATTNLGVYAARALPGQATPPPWAPDSAGLPDMTVSTNALVYFGANPLDARQQYCVVLDTAVIPNLSTVYTRTWPGAWSVSLLETTVQALADPGYKLYLRAITYDALGGYIYAGYTRQSPGGTIQSMVSVDNGATWSFISSMANTYCYYLALVARGNQVWAFGRFGAGGSTARVRYSVDGGVTFAASFALPGSGGQATNPHLTPIGKVYCKSNIAEVDGSDLLDVDAGGSTYAVLLDAYNLGPPTMNCLWENPDDAQHGRILKTSRLWVTRDGWATLVDANPATLTPTLTRLFVPVATQPDVMFLGQESPSAGAPVTVYRLDGEEGALAPFSGENPGTAPYTGSIPYTAGGLCPGGFAVYKD